MAAHASEERRGPLAGWMELLAPAPGRLEFAWRLALICALTTLVVQVFQTPEAALTAYVSFFVIKPDRATSAIMSIAMLILITLVIGLVVLLSIAVIDHPLLRVSAMTALSFGLLFTASASKLRPVGGIIALIVAYALDLLGSAPIGELATRALLYAWLFVGIPVGVSVAVNLLIGPAPRSLAQRAIAHRLELAAAVLRSPELAARRAVREALAEGSGEILTWLKLAAVEKSSRARDIDALRQAAASSTRILLLVELVDRNGVGRWPPALRERVARVLTEMGSILRTGAYPVEIAPAGDDADASASPEGAAILAEMKEALTGFAEVPAAEAPQRHAAPAPPTEPQTAKAKGGFFLPDAFSNPAHVHYALKTTAAAMFCYMVYSLLDWPGIHTSLITCYIVSLGTTGETVEKLGLRILGCLVGAAAGVAAIVFLMPDVTSIGGLLAVVFVAALASGWVAAGSPRIAYAGFQIAFAFFLCVIQGSSPAFDLAVARDRVVGILFGNLVVYLVFTMVWPVSVAARIDPAIAALLRRLGALTKAGPDSSRYALAAEAHVALGTLEQDLGIARYEPRTIRPGDAWLANRRRAARELAELPGSLLLGARLDPVHADARAARLDRLADTLVEALPPSGRHEGALGARPQQEPEASIGTERQPVDFKLANLERLLHQESAGSGDGVATRGKAAHGPA